MNKRSLTVRYTVHQVTYWASAAGVVSFATAFLLGKGFAPAVAAPGKYYIIVLAKNKYGIYTSPYTELIVE